MGRAAAAVAGGAVLAAAVLGGAGLAYAGGAVPGSDAEGTVSGPEAEAATRSALDVTGGGTANAVERDDEDGATWEVEVTRTDGATVDVRLDERYRLVVVEADHEDAGEGADGT